MNVRLGVDIQSLWCIEHGLNHVAQDLTEVENNNFVIMFIRWITANDRLVSYTAFARRNQETKKKKVPSLSETRWLFMRDALAAILDQTETVEAFLDDGDNRNKWARHISAPEFHLERSKMFVFLFKTRWYSRIFNSHHSS